MLNDREGDEPITFSKENGNDMSTVQLPEALCIALHHTDLLMAIVELHNNARCTNAWNVG